MNKVELAYTLNSSMDPSANAVAFLMWVTMDGVFGGVNLVPKKRTAYTTPAARKSEPFFVNSPNGQPTTISQGTSRSV